jgi:cyclohexanone monooxygenase
MGIVMSDVMEKSITSENVTQKVDVMIVGAGFAGMYLLHKLRGLGISARVFDAAGSVGGTWYWNRYPGARCDVESINYSYSFDSDLEQEWTWSEKYAPQPEILQYANHVADRFNLWPDMQFDTRIDGAHFNEKENRWTVKTSKGDVVSAQHLVLAVGTLSAPKLPEIKGQESFKGNVYETMKWPHEGVDFTGRRVAVIGTGSSGIQLIPNIAEQAAQLTVFQRTPNFSVPARNRKLTVETTASAKAAYKAGYRQAARESGFGVPGAVATQSALEVSEEERQATFQAGWDSGTLIAMIGCYTDILVNKEANDTVADFIRAKIREIVKDPVIAETLCPYSHPVGTKRPCLDTNYYQTFNSPHVKLVDLLKTSITDITPKGINTTTENLEFDDIVFATGFDAITGSMVRIDIRGRDGVDLATAWKDGPATLLGLQVTGFPNMFTVTGPQSPSVLSNMMISIEQHIDWITDCISHMKDNGLATVEADKKAQAEWVEHSNEVGMSTLYPLANSYYMGTNVPGKARAFLPYIGGVGPYRKICDDIAAQGYKGFNFSQ